MSHAFHLIFHSLMAVISYLRSLYKQRWSAENVPDDNMLVHDFNDGIGSVSAIPLDTMHYVPSITDTRIGDAFHYILQRNTVSNLITSVVDNTYIVTYSDSASVSMKYASGYDHHDINIFIYPAGMRPTTGYTERAASIYVADGCGIIPKWPDPVPGNNGTSAINDNTITFTNIERDYEFSIEISDAYANPYQISDSVSRGASITNVSIGAWFNIVNYTNNALDYTTLSNTYTTALNGEATAITLSYKTGYGPDDVSISSDDPNVAISNVPISTTTSKVTISGMSDTTNIAVYKNDTNKKSVVLESDSVAGSASITSIAIDDWFYYGNVSNQATSIVTIDGTYKTCRPGDNIDYKLTFATGYDPRNLDASGDGKFVQIDSTYYLRYSDVHGNFSAVLKERPVNVVDLGDYAEGSESISFAANLIDTAIGDYFHYANVENSSTHISFPDIVNGYVLFNRGCGYVTLRVIYESGYNSSKFTCSAGTLTNVEWTIPEPEDDLTLLIADSDYRMPQYTDDDIGLFRVHGNETLSQYRIISGSSDIITSYSFINDQPARMAEFTLWAFPPESINLNDDDLPASNPGSAVLVSPEIDIGHIIETIYEIDVDGNAMYHHTVTFDRGIALADNWQYIFKVRDGADTAHTKIACATGTTSSNVICSTDSTAYRVGAKTYLNWNISGLYVQRGLMLPYMEINNVRI